jgi:hypothetical protein
MVESVLNWASMAPKPMLGRLVSAVALAVAGLAITASTGGWCYTCLALWV